MAYFKVGIEDEHPTKLYFDNDSQLELFLEYLENTKLSHVKLQANTLKELCVLQIEERIVFLKPLPYTTPLVMRFINLTKIIMIDNKMDMFKSEEFELDLDNDHTIISVGRESLIIDRDVVAKLKAFSILMDLKKLANEITPEVVEGKQVFKPIDTQTINERIMFYFAYIESFKTPSNYSSIYEIYAQGARNLVCEYAGQGERLKDEDYKNLINLFLLIPVDFRIKFHLNEILKYSLAKYFTPKSEEEDKIKYRPECAIEDIFEDVYNKFATNEEFAAKAEFYSRLKINLFPQTSIGPYILKDEWGDSCVHSITKNASSYWFNGENNNCEKRYIYLQQDGTVRGHSGDQLGYLESKMNLERNKIFAHFRIIPKFKLYDLSKRIVGYKIYFLEPIDCHNYVIGIKDKDSAWVFKMDRNSNYTNLMYSPLTPFLLKELKQVLAIVESKKDKIFLFYFNTTCPIKKEVNISLNNQDNLSFTLNNFESYQEHNLTSLIEKNNPPPSYKIVSKLGDIFATVEKFSNEEFIIKGSCHGAEDFQINLNSGVPVTGANGTKLSRHENILRKNIEEIFNYFELTLPNLKPQKEKINKNALFQPSVNSTKSGQNISDDENNDMDHLKKIKI